MNFERLALFLKILLPLFAGILLGISALPHDYLLALQKAVFTENHSSFLESSEANAQAALFFPWRADLWQQAGKMALNSDEPAKAISYFKHALELDALSPQGMIELGQAYQKINDLAQAIATWNAALGNPAVDPQLHELLASTYLQKGEYALALEHFKALAWLFPEQANYVYQVGLIQAFLEPKASTSSLTLAAEIDLGYLERVRTLQESLQTGLETEYPAFTLVSAGRGLASIGEWRLAEEAFSRAIDMQPEYAEGWAYRGEARQQLGENGFDDLEKALSLNPRSVVANTLMGLYWQRHSDFEQALSYFEAVAKLDPTNPALQAEIGNSIALSGDLNLALTYFQRATELEPDSEVYFRMLAEFCIRHEIQVQEVGLPAALKAISLAPAEAASQDVLAQIYILLEEQDLALAALQKALALNPDYAPAKLHLGFISILQGQFSQAEQTLKEALDLSKPGDPVHEQAQRLLDNLHP